MELNNFSRIPRNPNFGILEFLAKSKLEKLSRFTEFTGMFVGFLKLIFFNGLNLFSGETFTASIAQSFQ